MIPEQVQEYFERKIAFVPLVQGEKFPPRGFPLSEFRHRRATWTEVKRWASEYPNSNWAIVTGKLSNVVVLDIDGPTDFFAATSTEIAKTTRYNTNRGTHILFTLPSDFDYHHQMVAPNVEILAGGWLAVAPPSTIEGITRKFEIPLSQQLPLPFEIESLIVNKPKQTQIVEFPVQDESIGRSKRKCLRQIWESEIRPGERDIMLWVLYNGLIFWDRHEEGYARTIVCAKNSRLSLPLSEKELLKIFKKHYSLSCETVRAKLMVSCMNCPYAGQESILSLVKRLSGDELRVMLYVKNTGELNCRSIAKELGMGKTKVWEILRSLRSKQVL